VALPPALGDAATAVVSLAADRSPPQASNAQASEIRRTCRTVVSRIACVSTEGNDQRHLAGECAAARHGFSPTAPCARLTGDSRAFRRDGLTRPR
jgi:hypothetical protein